MTHPSRIFISIHVRIIIAVVFRLVHFESKLVTLHIWQPFGAGTVTNLQQGGYREELYDSLNEERAGEDGLRQYHPRSS